jgi:hypothetical protein
MSGMVLATSAGQSVKKVFCVRPCRTDARSSLTHLARFPTKPQKARSQRGRRDCHVVLYGW